MENKKSVQTLDLHGFSSFDNKFTYFLKLIKIINKTSILTKLMLYFFAFGSNTSRRKSPIMLRDITKVKIVKPGKINNHGA